MNKVGDLEWTDLPEEVEHLGLTLKRPAVPVFGDKDSILYARAMDYKIKKYKRFIEKENKHVDRKK